MRRRASDPDQRRHGFGLRVHSLPYAAYRPAITPARGHLALALGEAICGEGGKDLRRRSRPTLLVLAPRHLTLLAQLIETPHGTAHLSDILPPDPQNSRASVGPMNRLCAMVSLQTELPPGMALTGARETEPRVEVW